MAGLWSFRLTLFNVVTCNKITVVNDDDRLIDTRALYAFTSECDVSFTSSWTGICLIGTRKRLYRNKQWWFLFAAEEYELISSNIYLYSVIVACSNRFKSIVVCWSSLKSTETCRMGIIFEILLWSILIEF